MTAGDLITRDGQIEFGGVLLGSTTPYRWLELTGWEDMPPLDSGSAPRPNRHGSWPGRLYSQQRIVTYSSTVSTAIPADFGAAITALRRATPVDSGDVDLPLVVRTKWGETLLAYGRVTQRAIPNSPQAGIGRGKATIQWTCADPRRYSVALHSTPIPQPTSGAGLTYPLTYPLDYGTGGDSGARLITNAGEVAASPVITITGPCTLPSVVAVASGYVLELDLILAAAETVVIDTGDGSVTLGGADRLYSLTGRSVPPEFFTLPPGSTEIAFRASVFGGGSSCTVTWRDAYL